MLWKKKKRNKKKKTQGLKKRVTVLTNRAIVLCIVYLTLAYEGKCVGFSK